MQNERSLVDDNSMLYGILTSESDSIFSVELSNIFRSAWNEVLTLREDYV